MQRHKDSIAVILAGGASSRMGVPDKGELSLGAARVVDHVFQRVLTQVDTVVISGSHDYNLGLINVPDRNDGPVGPTAGIYAIWHWIQQENSSVSGFMTVPVDGPFLPDDLLVKFGTGETSAVAFSPGGLQPTFAWWRMIDLALVFETVESRDKLSLKRLAQLCHAQEITWDTDEPFLNLNSPDDLQQAKILLG